MASPLADAEDWLAARLLALQRQLPRDGANTPLWLEYVETVTALTRVREQLAPRAPAPRPQRRRPA